MALRLLIYFVSIFNCCFLIGQERSFSQEQLLGRSNPEFYNDSIALLPEAGKAFEAMQKAARKAGIELEIVSPYRSYKRQQAIWNRKYTSNAALGLTPEQNIAKIIEYSTLPGTSRHHWGTDVDLIDGSKEREGDVLVAEKFHDKGPYVELKNWMDKHAEQFGYVLPYTKDPERKGFYYEPWHYSYAPLSVPMLKAYLELDLRKLLVPESLEGSRYITQQFLERYIQENVLGITPQLK